MTETDAERLLARLQHGRPRYRATAQTELEDLRARLNETALWCARFATLSNIQACLRPSSIAPHPLSTNRWEAVDQVRHSRATDVGSPAADSPPAGRLLLYFPDEEVWDGASEAASDGFFDVHDAPPWGTWVGYFEDEAARNSPNYLPAWCPDALVGVASAGMAVNPVDCIKWLADVDVDLRSVIVQFDSRWVG